MTAVAGIVTLAALHQMAAGFTIVDQHDGDTPSLHDPLAANPVSDYSGVTLMPKLGKKTGRPARPPMTKDEEQSLAAELFWSLVDRKGPFPPCETKVKTRCWEWIGGVNKESHGRFRFNRKNYYARRFAWTLRYGEPKGLLVTDRCGNKQCVRHLRTFPRSENMMKAALVNRQGEQHANAKLSDKKVREIRAASARGKTRQELARKFKVSHAAITHVVTRRSWKHI
jgi:HNH endonuclease